VRKALIVCPTSVIEVRKSDIVLLCIVAVTLFSFFIINRIPEQELEKGVQKMAR
jgi:hypothetical protein